MIDLRSDTVTKPSKDMLNQILEAEFGDDEYKEDPTVNSLEEYCANLMGFEAGLFVTSGLMGNQISLLVHTDPGQEVVTTQDSHIKNYEHGAAAFLSRIQFRDVDSHNGVYDLDNSVTVLTGKNLRLKTALETIRARKSLEYWDKKRVAIAKGNATAQRGEKQVRADTLTVYFSKTKNDSLTANRIEAVGNVKITTPNEVAVGDEAVYYIEKELVTLLGHVKITRGKSQLNGSIAEVNLKTGRSRLLSKSGLDGNQKVRGLFTRDVKQPEKK